MPTAKPDKDSDESPARLLATTGRMKHSPEEAVEGSRRNNLAHSGDSKFRWVEKTGSLRASQW